MLYWTIFYQYFGYFFNYLESEGKIKTCLCHYQSYYNSVKKDLKSDHACEIIEEIAISIEINMRCLWHYHFIDVTTLDSVGVSIIEGSNCGLKRGDNSVSTNMNIDTLALTQIQISEIQAQKTYLAIMV